MSKNVAITNRVFAETEADAIDKIFKKHNLEDGYMKCVVKEVQPGWYEYQVKYLWGSQRRAYRGSKLG